MSLHLVGYGVDFIVFRAEVAKGGGIDVALLASFISHQPPVLGATAVMWTQKCDFLSSFHGQFPRVLCYELVNCLQSFLLLRWSDATGTIRFFLAVGGTKFFQLISAVNL